MKNNDNEIRKNIRNNLMTLRKLHELSQTDVAKFTGKNPKTVASWEQGISLPDAYTLFRIAKRYHVSMDYLYEDHSGNQVLIETVKIDA